MYSLDDFIDNANSDTLTNDDKDNSAANKTRGGSPVDNRPSTDELHNFKKEKKKKNIYIYI